MLISIDEGRRRVLEAVRPLAERMVTLGKKGSLHARRTAVATLRQKDAVQKLFDKIAPASAERNGGYTRIIKLGQRKSDAAPMALIEWVDAPVATAETTTEEKGKKGKAAKTPATEAKEARPSRKKKSSETNE